MHLGHILFNIIIFFKPSKKDFEFKDLPALGETGGTLEFPILALVSLSAVLSLKGELRGVKPVVDDGLGTGRVVLDNKEPSFPMAAMEAGTRTGYGYCGFV